MSSLSSPVPLRAQPAPPRLHDRRQARLRPAPSNAKKPAPAKTKPKDPFTTAQRRELERIVEEARRALAKEREEVEAALARLREEREALEREKAEVEAKKAAVEQQAAKVEALAKELELQKIRLDEVVQSIPSVVQPSQELVERLAKLEEASKQKPDLPPEVVSAGDFPGSIRIPGSLAAIKFGGSVWVSAVSTLDALGSDDRFLTWTIPVVGDPDAGKGPRTSFWANPSSLNFDVADEGTGRPDDPRLRRGGLRRRLERLPPPARLRPGRRPPRRPDLVDVLGPGRRQRRHRLRGRERRERPAPGTVPLHAPPQPGAPPGGLHRVPQRLPDGHRRIRS